MKLKQEPVRKWYCGDCRELRVLNNMKSGWRRKEEKPYLLIHYHKYCLVETIPVRSNVLFLKFIYVHLCKSSSSGTISFNRAKPGRAGGPADIQQIKRLK